MTTPRGRLARAALCLTPVLLLAACGGGGGGSTPFLPVAPPAPAPAPAPAPSPAPAPRPKALVIGVDGVQYAALQQALGDARMPALQGLGTLLPSYTGGVLGRRTQQQATDGPSWATLLTGGWADRHEIRSNYEGQAFGADTVFKLLKQHRADTRSAVVASWSGLPQLLRADKAAGYLELAKDCDGSDDCVSTEAAGALESGGYDLVVADYQGPAQVADVAGYGTDYQNALAQVDKQIATLRAALARRRAAQPQEDWLVVVATTHGLGATGVADGIPVPSNLATALVLDRRANLDAVAPAGLPANIADWYGYASTADIAPTLLTHLSALPAADTYAIDGAPLLGAPGVRQLAAVANDKRNGIRLSWTLPAPVASITVLRDGTAVATLPGTALGFEDTTMPFDASGTYAYDYTVVADKTPVSLRASLDYVKPIVLLPSVANGLTHLFPLNGALGDRLAGGQVFAPWVKGATAVYAAAGDGPLGSGTRALLSTDYTGATVCAACDGGYSIPTAGVTSTTAPFSFGFWFRSDATRSGMPVISNKNWASGANPGIAIGQYGSALRFNIGRGGDRVGDKDLGFSANTWAYVVMTVDVPALKATYYVFDPALGLQSISVTLTSAFTAALNGLNKGFSLNEDGDGGYGPNYRNGNASNTIAGRFDFAEFATWNRVLSAAEIESIARSRGSLTTLVP
ncbi:LamG domain-containing protein [Variovorax sp. CY25R-8]|uniref:LamG domain-containing protein n=1 Tax=Variovorax sp. CY25R-8 TaxID=2855501 RepID=UPI0021BB103F|nr:LamG domain-containing protein [Variovorax sp. CY25R-8]MCT8174301.1 LamG domain-containing protein [Variovorax sp. CY25R-8]